MKKYFSILLSFSLLALFFPSIIRLQAQIVSIPNVYIKNIQLQKTNLTAGETVSGTFQAITDAPSVASDIYFNISLVGDYQKNTLAGTFYDTTTTASSYEIKAGETKTINFSYTIPQVKTGTGYGIQVGAMTHTGIPLGWSDALVKITNSGNVQYLDTISANLIVGTSTFALQEGPMVSSVEQPVLDIVVNNPTSQPVTFTPSIALYNHVVLGQPISTVTGSSTTIAANKQKEILITLPTNNDTPLVYVSHVSFLDANKIQRLTALDARYIVEGDIATIQSVTTDKKSFNKGDNVAVKLAFSGTPTDLVTGDNSIDATYGTQIKLLDDQGQSIAAWTGLIDYNSATSTKTVILVAQQSANGYSVDVTVSKAGKTITHYSTKIAPDITIASNSSMSIFGMSGVWVYYLATLLCILLLAMLLIAAVRSQKYRFLCVLLIILGLVLAYFALKNVQQAFAASGPTPVFVLDLNYNSTDKKHTVYTLTFSSPTGSVMQPGEVFWVTGNSTQWACSNGPKHFEIQMTFNGVTHFYADPKSAISHSQFSVGPFTAPTTAGTYTMSMIANLVANSDYVAGQFTREMRMYWLGHMDFTTATPPALPDLTASLVTPVSATVGVPVSLSAVVYNADASTGAGFTNLFQQASDVNGTGATDIGTSAQPSALLSGDSAAASLSHTFTSAGTYYLRVCADRSSAGNAGVITESNENNNCSPTWTATTVTDSSSGAISSSCSVSPSSGLIGTIFTWSATDPTGGNGTFTYSWSGTGGLSGTTQSVDYPYFGLGNYTGSVTVSSSGYTSQIFYCTNSAAVVTSTTTSQCSGDGCSSATSTSTTTPGGGGTGGTGTCNPWVTDANGNHVASFANVGQLVTWMATGDGPYSWSGDGVVGSPTGSTYSVRYNTIGHKSMTLNGTSCITDVNGLPNRLPIISDPTYEPF